MAQGKPICDSAPAGSIQIAISDGDWPAARHAMAVKLARMMDNTDSARDVKSIALSLIPLLDKCEEDARRADETADTPLSQVLAEAEKALANA